MSETRADDDFASLALALLKLREEVEPILGDGAADILDAAAGKLIEQGSASHKVEKLIQRAWDAGPGSVSGPDVTMAHYQKAMSDVREIPAILRMTPLNTHPETHTAWRRA